MKKPTNEEINNLVAEFDGHPQHYKLLGWFSLQFNNIIITEVGTHKGYGAQALAFNKRNKVKTFDIKSRDGEIELPENVEKKKIYDGWMDEVMESSIIFYDTSHNGKDEREFYKSLIDRDFRGILILDDIHFNDEMISFWNDITHRKEDWTDVGHSPSGTGVVYFYPTDMIVHDEPIEFYVDKINKGEPFKFLRFGDGEWLVHKGLNKSIALGEHYVFPEITEDIRNIVRNLNPKHYNGLQSLSVNLPNINYQIPRFDWYNSDVFHFASMQGKLKPFIDSLKDKNVVIVSSAKMREIKPFVNYSDFIEVRDVDCYWDKDMVLEKMREYPSGTIFLFCASRMSVPVIYHSERDDCTMIDLGSLFDPYIGVNSRRYHGLLTKEVMEKNGYIL